MTAIQPNETDTHDSSAIGQQRTSGATNSKRPLHVVLLLVGICTTVLAQLLSSFNVVNLVIQPITYSVILGLVALGIAGARGNARKFWFRTFAWLFFVAGLFDVVVQGYLTLYVRPQLDRALAEVLQKEFPSNARPGRASSENLQRSPLAMPQRATVTGRFGSYSIEYDDAKWDCEFTPEPEGDKEFSFVHRDGDVFAMVISERIPLSREVLRKVVLDNASSAASDLRILREESRLVSGENVLCLTMTGTLEKTPFIYHGYYYTGQRGTIQVITFTSKSLFDQYAKDMSAFLDGFRVLPDSSAVPRAQTALVGHWVTSDKLVNYYFSLNKMTVVYPSQPGRTLAYSVLNCTDNAITLKMIGGNMPHTRRFVVHGNGAATQTMEMGKTEAKYEMRFVDDKQSP
jgi:hypothetical protein